MERNVTMDGLRGIAALCVLLYHLGALLDISIMPGGYLAVDFFFCLSGYMLARVYVDRFRVREFTRIRLARLYPLFLLGLGLGVAKTLAQGVLGLELLPPADFARAFTLNVVMLPDLGGQIYPFNGPSWTLFLEMVLSVAFAAFLCRMRSIGLMLLTLLGASGMVWAVARYGWLNVGWDAETLPFGLARAVFGFCAGMLIERVSMAKVLSAPWLVLALVAGMFLPDLVFALVISPLIVALARSTNAPERMRPVFEWAGNVSYPLYAVHWPIAVAIVFAGEAVGLSAPAILAFGVLGSVAAADLAFRFYDRPVRSWLACLGRRAVPAR